MFDTQKPCRCTVWSNKIKLCGKLAFLIGFGRYSSSFCSYLIALGSVKNKAAKTPSKLSLKFNGEVSNSSVGDLKLREKL